MNAFLYVPNQGGVLRTSTHQRSRLGTALLLCGALLIVPLVVITSGSSLSASGPGRAPSRSHGASQAPGRAGYFPAWQLAADTIKSSAAAAAGVGQPVPPIPTTTVATTPPTTATTAPPTTQPQPAYTPPTTLPAPAPAPNSITGIVTYYHATPGTCASPTLAFGTVVTITNPDNGATVSCTVDDREADTERQIDLATDTFAEIAPLSQGVISDAELSW